MRRLGKAQEQYSASVETKTQLTKPVRAYESKTTADRCHGMSSKHFPIERLHSRPGKPSDKRVSNTELINRWYLIWISEKYGLNTREFLACFPDAWMHEKSSCGDLLVQCRKKSENVTVFLVTHHQKIITQLSLSESALKRLADVDLSFPWNDSASFESRAKHVNVKAA
jgi:hypothetical protein